MFTEAATYVVIRADLRLVLVEVARRRLVASGSTETIERSLTNGIRTSNI
jgi:hypothetical protein